MDTHTHTNTYTYVCLHICTITHTHTHTYAHTTNTHTNLHTYTQKYTTAQGQSHIRVIKEGGGGIGTFQTSQVEKCNPSTSARKNRENPNPVVIRDMDSFICVTWHIHAWHKSFICDMTLHLPRDVWKDITFAVFHFECLIFCTSPESFIREYAKRLINLWRGTILCVIWHIRMCTESQMHTHSISLSHTHTLSLSHTHTLYLSHTHKHSISWTTRTICFDNRHTCCIERA